MKGLGLVLSDVVSIAVGYSNPIERRNAETVTNH